MPKTEKVVSAVEAVRPTKLKNIELIKRHEGLRLKAYLPTPNDVWTIGYGHTKTAKQGMSITESQADLLLRQDVEWVEKAINRLVTVPINQNQFDALGSLVFNIGATAFAKSSVLKRLNEKDYNGAADAFLMWTKQRDRKTNKMNVLPGLVKRRQEERQLFLKGTL